MSSLPAPTPSDASPLTDDFEWPPKADNVSVHEIEADPWHPTDGADDVHDTITVTVVVDTSCVATPLPSPSRRR